MSVATSPAPPTTSPLGRAFWVAFAGILLGEALDLLDSLVTTVAGPSIVRDIGGSDTVLQWLAAGYTLALAGGVLLGGRLGDRFGRRRLFLLGMAGFTVTSLAAALSQSPDLLLATRVAQGLLGALMLPQSLGLIRDIAPPEKMGAAFGVFGVTMGLAGIAGPIVSGLLVQADILGLGWRSIFLINIPLGVAGLIIGHRYLPRTPGDPNLTIDLTGCFLAVGVMVALVLPLIEGREQGWPLWTFGLFGFGVALLAGLVVHQRRRAARGADPLVLPSLFARRQFVGGTLLSLCFFTAFMASGFVLAILFQVGLGMSPLAAAFFMLPQALGMTIGFKLSGRLSRGRSQLIAGFALALAADLVLVLLLLTLGGSINGWWLAPALLLAGLGAGVAMGPLFDVIISDLPEAETGSASGVLNAVQQVGSATGVAALGSALFAVAAGHGGGLSGFAAGAAAAYGVAAGLLVAALALTWWLIPARQPDAAPL